jgi:hypothetical protein
MTLNLPDAVSTALPNSDADESRCSRTNMFLLVASTIVRAESNDIGDIGIKLLS